jgi:hypothetical protein
VPWAPAGRSRARDAASRVAAIEVLDMPDELVCWRCGESLADLPLPLARLAECPACRIELHVCRMCRHYDTSVAKSCREPVAEEVSDKERANFCGWFMPRPGTYAPGNEREAVAAQAALDALFGGPPSSAGGPAPGAGEPAADAGRELDNLFRPRDPDDGRRR